MNEQLIRYLAKHPEVLRSSQISPRRFEEIVAEIWRGFGYEVELTKQTRDGGYDITAIRSTHVREKYLIECKRFTDMRTVGVGVVRQLYGVVKSEEATKGIIATTTSLSRDAMLFVTAHQWVLDARDFEGINEWISTYLKRSFSVRPAN
ncbi:MAG: restriction endonuclease [Thermoanaerobaculia bacterium]